MKELIREMERYATLNNISIIEVESMKFIMQYIRDNNVKSVLEIGSSIGYSSILMANASKEVHITTIEKDMERYKEAVKNVKTSTLDRQIDVVYNDALDVNLVGHSYDLIFIDAAKGDYIKFFDKFHHYLNEGGVIITDNINYHGFVGNKKDIECENLKGLVSKIEKYIKYLQNNEEFITNFYEIGDGLSVSIKKTDK